jgi:hypothetical protein
MIQLSNQRAKGLAYTLALKLQAPPEDLVVQLYEADALLRLLLDELATVAGQRSSIRPHTRA